MCESLKNEPIYLLMQKSELSDSELAKQIKNRYSAIKNLVLLLHYAKMVQQPVFKYKN
jgi:hypothetical protein